MKIYKIAEKYPWKDVDWSKKNMDIAKELGAPPKSVPCYRKKYDTNYTPRPKPNWANVDWNMSNNTEIARELGVSRKLVRKYRADNFPETVEPNQIKYLSGSDTDWDNVDWTKDNNELASELGVHYTTVSKHRPNNRPNKWVISPYNWDNVDWTKGTMDIAKELGCHHTTVSKNRKNKAPDTMYLDMDFYGTDWTMENEDIANIMGVSIPRVRAWRKKLAPDTVQDISERYGDWDNMDWSKHTTDIAEETGMHVSTVSTQRGKKAPHTLRMAPYKKHNWDSVDWSKSNKEIVEYLIMDLIDRELIVDDAQLTKTYLHGLYQSVSMHRSKNAKDTLTQYPNWYDVDWSKSNGDIADEKGVTSGHVWEKRRELAPHTMPSNQLLETANSSNWYKRSQSSL